ncbi:MAG: DUF2520 domain-containing protein [Acidobacteria bacterium]|nr:DUF2520 domain-containing protein [Acidobacteriota bacterium]
MKALSPRVASRIVNRLRAGYPVSRYEDLEPAGLIVLCVEDSPLLLRIVAEMAASESDWKHHSIILCHPVVESSDLAALTDRGARIASLWIPEEAGRSEYLAEGDRQAIRELRQALGAPKQGIRVLRKGGKLLYLAGLTFASSFITPLAGAAVECLRAAGLNPPAASATLDQAIIRALRAYRKAGRKGWAGPLADAANCNVRGQLEALAGHDPALAEFFRATALLAHQRLGRPAGWAEPPHQKTTRRS